MISVWYYLLNNLTLKAKRSLNLEVIFFFFFCPEESMLMSKLTLVQGSCGRYVVQGQLGPVEQAGWGLRL